MFTDDIGRQIKLKSKINRIVSLVPSITELLFDLGLTSELVACTNYCKYPKDRVGNILKVGGTKDFDLDKIRQVKPELIIAVKEENNRELVLEIAKEFPTIVFDIVNLKSALRSIKLIGEIVSKEKEAESLLAEIDSEILKLKNKRPKTKKTVAYLIWHKPMMSVNTETYISDIIVLSAYSNVFDKQKENYFEFTEEELKAKKPNYIFLSSEPFKFTEKHKQAYQKQYPDSKVVLVDGEMFSWYGSRLLKAISYFKELNSDR